MGKENKIEHDKKALLEQLEKTLGVVSTACAALKMSRTTFYRYYNNDSDFREKVKDIQENVAVDFSESKLFKQVQKENITAIIYHLNNRGRKRGYGVQYGVTETEGEDSSNQGFLWNGKEVT